jgi:hypothetical protein
MALTRLLKHALGDGVEDVQQVGRNPCEFWNLALQEFTSLYV